MGNGVPRKINDGLTNEQRYKLRHPERVEKTRRNCSLKHDYHKRNSESKRRSAYGKDAVKYYNRTLLEQDNRCAVCGKVFTRTASQDHNHACCPTQKTCGKCKRGLVCQSCNMGLYFAENPDWLDKAKQYLNKWRA